MVNLSVTTWQLQIFEVDFQQSKTQTFAVELDFTPETSNWDFLFPHILPKFLQKWFLDTSDYKGKSHLNLFRNNGMPKFGGWREKR